MKEIIEDNNKTEISDKSKIELRDYEFDYGSQENDSNFDLTDDNIHDTTTIDLKDENVAESKCYSYCFVKYFDYFIPIILYINSFIYFSYINLIHFFYLFFIINSKYSTKYGFFMRNKGKMTAIFLFSEFIYLIFKIIIISINSSRKQKILEDVFPENKWTSIYEYIFEAMLIILLLIYLIINNFSYQTFKINEFEDNKKFLDTKLSSNNNILNFGLILIIFGCTLSPSIINLILLVLALIFFFLTLFFMNRKKFIKKNFCRIYIFMTCLYICYNYLLNSPNINADYKFGKINLFEDSDRYLSIATMILFLIGIYFLNINLKIYQYIFFRQFESLTFAPPQMSEEKEEDALKTSNKYTKVKSEIKLETLFATDIDCGIIVFSKESKKYNLTKKIKLFILKFCYTPGFCLHACRLSTILWINLYMTYVSVLLIIWLIFSIKYSMKKFFLFGTKYIIYPSLILLFLVSYISIVFHWDESTESEQKITEYLGIREENENKSMRGLHLCIKIIIIIIFQLFIKIKTKHSQQLEEAEILDEIKNQQKQLEKRIEQDFKGKYVIKPFEIFFKLYFFLLDIAVIVLFYLAASQSINIFNELVLLCLISLFLMGKQFMGRLYFSLLVLNISFLLKYIIYFINNTRKVKIQSSNTKLVLALLFNDNLNKIHYFWCAFYLLFLEYIGQTSKLFKLCKNKKFSIYEIVEHNLSSHEFIKFILETIFNFIFGIYIWLLIPSFIYCLLLRDNNVFGLFQLLIVFIIYYKYIKIVGEKFSTLSNIFTYTRILIGCNVFNLTMLYAVQFLNKPPVSVWYALISEREGKTLELIGFFLFNESYDTHLLPYFIMFILSLGLHQEISRQIKLNTKDANIKKESEKNMLIYRAESIASIEKEEKDSKKIKLLDDYLKIDSNSLSLKSSFNSKSSFSEKEYNEEKRKKLEKKIKENQRTKYFIKKIFLILYYILHYYWIIIFFFVAILSIHWMLSVSMVIQLTIFCFYMLKSFKGYSSFLKNDDINESTLNQKLKKYREEKKLHFKMTSEIQHSYFNVIWIFTFSSIILSYLCCIVIKYFQSSTDKDLLYTCQINIVNEDEEIPELKLFISIMYFLGFYSAPANLKTKTSFWSYTWGYFLTILLFSIRAYFLSKFAEIKTMYMTDEDKDSRKKQTYSFSAVSRQSKVLELFEAEKIQKFGDYSHNVSLDLDNYDNIKVDLEDFNMNESFDLEHVANGSQQYHLDENSKNIFDEGISNDAFQILDENEKIEKKRFYEKFFGKEHLEFLSERKNFNYSSDDFVINYKKNITNKNIEFKVYFSKKIKKISELLIIFLIFLNALLKCNILSFLFLIILLFTYHQKNISTLTFYKVSYFLLFLLIFQYMIFVSNISYITNSFIDKEIISCIQYYFGLPWSNKINYSRWATFFSLGTNRYQVETLWVDVCTILFLYFYLEFYSFSLYKHRERKEDLRYIYNKYNKKFKKLKTISKEEYNRFIRAMKFSYNIELIPSKKNIMYIYNDDNEIREVKFNQDKKYNKNLLKISYMFKNDKRYLFVNKTSKIRTLSNIINFIYISFHYILLSVTLFICLLNQGLLAIGYICFSIYYLYKSHCFLKGRRWSLLNGINYFMKPYLFLDIVIQFVFQIPFDVYIKNNEKLKEFNNVLGLAKISDYSSSSSRLMITDTFFMVFLKIFTYFLFLIQENLYLSVEFKKFILKYHYEYMQKAYIKGKLHSFLFNNYRVKLMNDRLIERNIIKNELFNIHNTVTNWNSNLIKNRQNKLTEENINNRNINNLYNLSKTQISQKKVKGITLRKIIKNHWLISLTLRVIESARTVDNEHFNIGGEILKILQGNTVLYSYLLELIDDFDKKNYSKYKDIKYLQKLKMQKEEIKKEKERLKSEKKKKKIEETKIKENKENIIEEEKDELIIQKDFKKKNSANINNINYRKNNFLKHDIKEDEKDNPKLEKIVENDEENILEEININKGRTKRLKSFDFTKQNKLFEHSKIKSLDEFDDYPEQSELRFKEENIIKEKEKGKNYIKLDQPYDEMFFPNWDFKDFKEMIIDDFFNNYCSRKRILLMLIKSIVRFFMENFEYIVYLLMLLDHLISGSLISMFYPVFIFLFGICQYPRPDKLFWKILLIYSALIILIKFIIQLNILEKNETIKVFLNDIQNDNLIINIGFKKIEKERISNFLSYILPDFLVLILIIINQFILIRKGLWYMTETDYETIEESNDRIIKYNSKKIKEEIGFNVDNKLILPQNQIVPLIGELKQPQKKKLIQRISNFYNKNFTRIRNEKPGQDYYMYYTIFLIFILIYIIFFYTEMEKDKMVYNVDAFKLKQFSGHTVIFAFIHVFLIVFDRFLYLKNARKLQKISFLVYDKNTGQDITSHYKAFKYEEIVTKIEKERYNKHMIIAYQYEEFHIGLLMKYITQVVAIILIHYFIYFYLPQTTYSNQQTLNQVINRISENPYTMVFYILYLFYFLFSSLQIKHGMTDIKKVSSLMTSTNFISSLIYKCYIQIPFLFELKNFIDWTFTKTSLDLWKWLKLEEIISLLYLNKTYSEADNAQRVGEKTKVYMKILMGSTTFFIVIIIIFGPLILFSYLNPLSLVNKVTGVNFKLILSLPTNYSQKLNLTLFETSNSYIDNFVSDDDYDKFFDKIDNLAILDYKKSFKYTQVQNITVIDYTETNWDISSKFIEYLRNIKETKGFVINLKYSFQREHDSSSQYYGIETQIIEPSFIQDISKCLNNEKSMASIVVDKCYSVYQRIPNDEKPMALDNDKKRINLTLKRDDNNVFNWYLETEKNEGIKFVTFSDLYSKVTFGYDVLTFYVTFVIVAGRIIRAIFLGSAERIMYIQMVNPNRLFALCEGIKISRIKNDFLQEEKLYYLLIELMRSPEIIKNMTQSSLIYIQDNNTVEKNFSNKDSEVESKPIIRRKSIHI